MSSQFLLRLAFGEQVVNAINNWIPIWVMNGLKAAGAILPAMGIAILMRYLPIKTYWPYFIIGFVLLAYGPILLSFRCRTGWLGFSSDLCDES